MTDRKFIADLIVARLDPLIRDLECEFHTDLMMWADNALGTAVLKLSGDTLWLNPHVYQRIPSSTDAGEQG